MIQTLVLHQNPDLEALFLAWVCERYESIRELIGIEDPFSLKFIPAGALREEDWHGLPLDVPALTRLGCLFTDCGGGYYDKHVHLGRDESSLDRFVRETGLLNSEPHLTSLIRVISANEMHGSRIVGDSSVREPGRQFTIPHLRNLIAGWNLLYMHEPLKVYRLAARAFDGIVTCLDEIARTRRARRLSDRDIAVRHMNLFMLPAIRIGLHQYLTEQFATLGENLARKEVQHELRVWNTDADRSLAVLHHQWQRAEEDFVRTAIVHDIGAFGVTFRVIVATSDSRAFGLYARLMHPHEATLQFRSDGKFTMSTTQNRSLQPVAPAIWHAELKARRVLIPPTLEGVLKGTIAASGDSEDPSRLFHIMPSGVFFGNYFHSNPHMPRSVLSPEYLTQLFLRYVR